MFLIKKLLCIVFIYADSHLEFVGVRKYLGKFCRGMKNSQKNCRGMEKIGKFEKSPPPPNAG